MRVRKLREKLELLLMERVRKRKRTAGANSKSSRPFSVYRSRCRVVEKTCKNNNRRTRVRSFLFSFQNSTVCTCSILIERR